MSLNQAQLPRQQDVAFWIAGVAAFVALWFVVYGQFIPLSDWAVSRLALVKGSQVPFTTRQRC